MSQGQRVLQPRSDLSGFRCPAASVLPNTPVYMHRASGVEIVIVLSIYYTELYFYQGVRVEIVIVLSTQ